MITMWFPSPAYPIYDRYHSDTTSRRYTEDCLLLLRKIRIGFSMSSGFSVIWDNPENLENTENLIHNFQFQHKQPIRITDSFSFDYTDSPYHLITSSPSSYGLSANTFSYLLKSPQKFIPISFLSENQCSLLSSLGRYSQNKEEQNLKYRYKLWVISEKLLYHFPVTTFIRTDTTDNAFLFERFNLLFYTSSR